MNIEQILERLEALQSFRRECAQRLSAITGVAEQRDGGQFNEAEQAEYDQLAEWVTAARAEEQTLEARKAVFEAANAPGATIVRGDGPRFNRNEDPFDLSTVSRMASASELRARARTAIERTAQLSDEHRAAATRVLERAEDKHGDIALRMLITGSETYRTAFQKVAGYNQHALTADEHQALARAASLTDNAGGYAVPFTLDPTIILTNDGAVNAIRQLARTVTIATDSWNGVSSAGVTAGYAAEAAEAGDNAPTLAQPSIAVRKGHAFVPFSIEIGMDWVNMEAEMRTLIADGRDRADATVFWSGASGSNQPIGIETALAGGSSIVASATAEVFALADISAPYTALAARYRTGAARTAAIAEFSTLQKIRSLLAAAGDRSSFNEATASMPATLFGWPILEHSECDAFSDVNAAANGTHHLLTVGDWRNYVIVDRAGMSIELVPHLFATGNNRPSGQRGFYAHWRTGADSVNDAAFKVLTVTTTA